MRFTVLTPCYNSGAVLEETMLSILTQTAVTSGRVELEYLICDGASTDDTRAVVERIGSPHVRFISEPDRGMYHALTKGLQRSTGELVSYLNAGDYYHKTALDVVADVFERHPDIHWLTGMNAFYNERSQVIEVKFPYRYRREFFRNGMHGQLLPTLQQESSFWRRGLHAHIDFERLATLRLAGDFYLWQQFSRVCRAAVVSAHLGGFKFHRGQQSSVGGAYKQELRSLASAARWRDYPLAWLDLLVWKFAPPGIKRRLNGFDHVVYDVNAGRWRRVKARVPPHCDA